MSVNFTLYDDFDAVKQKGNEVAGWSSGMKLFQSQLQLKKASHGQSKRETSRKVSSITPVFDLKSKRYVDDGRRTEINSKVNSSEVSSFNQILDATCHDLDWSYDEAEYDCLRPNDYEIVVKDLKKLREKEKEKEEKERKKAGSTRKSHFEPVDDGTDDEEDEPVRKGVAIAPPNFEEKVPLPKDCGISVAAKIMAKYGFKEGQGLGKDEQGISMALQVKKTSVRGGYIVHENDLMPPPPSIGAQLPAEDTTLPKVTPEQELSITEIIKTPSKVILLKNMVGPGEIDQELEPEVRVECNTKYGDVIRVVTREVLDVHPNDAVRIFVEFKRIESAIKAVVDLNGRFFGGRQVKAGFYPAEKFENMDLLD